LNEIVFIGDRVKLGQFALKEAKFAIDLVKGARIARLRVVRVLANFLKVSPGLPNVRRGIWLRFRLRIGPWLRLWLTIVKRAVRFTSSKFITDATLVVIASSHRVLCHVGDNLAGGFAAPTLLIIHGNVSRATIREFIWLVCTFEVTLSGQVEEI